MCAFEETSLILDKQSIIKLYRICGEDSELGVNALDSDSRVLASFPGSATDFLCDLVHVNQSLWTSGPHLKNHTSFLSAFDSLASLGGTISKTRTLSCRMYLQHLVHCVPNFGWNH